MVTGSRQIRPKRLIAYAMVAICGSLILSGLRQPLPAANIETKRTAIELALRAQSLLEGRLIGPEYSLITTTLAPKEAKQLSTHPDFAAVCVEWLLQAGVRTGNRIAVNLSGSFPALNIAVLSAVKAVGAEPVITSSVGASTWGANDPAFTWLDMEKRLQEAGIFAWRSVAASQGGVGDRGGGLTAEGRELLTEALLRNQVPPLRTDHLQQAIEHRLEIYRATTGELPMLLINVGGSHVIFGERGHRSPLPQGLNRGYHPLLVWQEGLAAAFLQSNRPVIHFLNIQQLAVQYAIQPDRPVGSSRAFSRFQLSFSARIIGALCLSGVLVYFWRRRPTLHRL